MNDNKNKQLNSKSNKKQPFLKQPLSTEWQREEEQQFIAKLIKKDAQIYKADKERKANEKQMKYIEKSNTWKSSAPIRKITNKFGSTEKHQAQEISELQAELKATRKELYETREELHEATLDDRSMSGARMLNTIREQIEEGNLIDYIAQTVKQKQQHEANYNEALRYMGRVFMNEKAAYKQTVYSKILEALKIEDIPEYLIREGLTEEPIPLKQAASFRGSLNMRIRQKQLEDTLPEWLLDDKHIAYSFMDQLNIRKPWTSETNYKLADIPQKESIVIKPAEGAGSRGVYLVHAFNDIIDVKRSKKLDSWQTLNQSMKEDLQSGWVSEDQWYIEELILENKPEKIPASDIKFYCFYGKVGLILEISRYPELKYCWWTADGKRIHTGKYEDNPFKGKGVTQDEMELASYISAQIPAPFMRIDFLRSDKDLVFGEFTPKPGNYDGFDTHTDQWMGDYFLEAQGRLMQDLLNGKEFTAYMELKKRHNK
ncbi:ATP-grasp fold amidoligase family protein [Virgibacillus ainsalahensis]